MRHLVPMVTAVFAFLIDKSRFHRIFLHLFFEMQNIAVFLSSATGLPESYGKAAAEVGAFIGQTGRTLVYGGAAKGLMETLACTVKEAGGRIYGVVPDIIEQQGLVSKCVDVVFRCVDLSDRKAVMMREADVCLVLPGGVGTLDELFTVLAARTIGLTTKPVLLYNVDGCWDRLLELLDDLREKKLVSSDISSLFTVVSSVAELNERL